MVGGAVALALAPNVLAAYGPPPGIISLRYNENPYGPSAKAIQAASQALRKGAYYADPVQSDLFGAITAKYHIQTLALEMRSTLLQERFGGRIDQPYNPVGLHNENRCWKRVNHITRIGWSHMF